MGKEQELSGPYLDFFPCDKETTYNTKATESAFPVSLECSLATPAFEKFFNSFFQRVLHPFATILFCNNIGFKQEVFIPPMHYSL